MEEFEQQKPPFYERRGFQGAVAIVGLLTAVWALSGAPKPWQVASEITASTVTLSNTEIILDASAKTAAPFGAETKLQAAERAVGQYATPLNTEGIALRRAGGSCAEAGELVVGFGADHGEEVAREALTQEPRGKANVANAVRAAIDEFEGAGYKAPDTTERIVIFMSGEDECSADPAVEIRDALDHSEVDAVFRVIALRPSPRQLSRLKGFKRQLASFANVEIDAPSTQHQLRQAVRREVEATQAASAAARRRASPATASAADEGSGGQGENGGSNESSDGSSGQSEKPSQHEEGKEDRARRLLRRGHGGGGEACEKAEEGETRRSEAAGSGVAGTTGAEVAKAETGAGEGREGGCEEGQMEAAERPAAEAEERAPPKEEGAGSATTTTPAEREATSHPSSTAAPTTAAGG